ACGEPTELEIQPKFQPNPVPSPALEAFFEHAAQAACEGAFACVRSELQMRQLYTSREHCVDRSIGDLRNSALPIAHNAGLVTLASSVSQACLDALYQRGCDAGAFRLGD